MTKLQRCVVKVLEGCEESTPANLVDAMFKFVRNKTPCANMTTTTGQLTSDYDDNPNSAVRFISSLVVVAFAAIITVLM